MFGGAAVGSLVLGAEMQPIENREGGGFSALGGRCLIWKTQQPTKSWRLLWGRYWGGCVTAVKRVGERFAIVWGRRIR